MSGLHHEDSPQDPANELVDEVDRSNNIIRQTTRREVRTQNLLHRGVGILCTNSAGEIYVHRRTQSKDVFPGMYDMFVGGVVTSGETYEAAAAREIDEELGIAGVEPRFLFRHLYWGAHNRSWVAVYSAVWDGKIRHQASEVDWGAYFTLDELMKRIEEWPFVPDGLEIFAHYLQSVKQSGEGS